MPLFVYEKGICHCDAKCIEYSETNMKELLPLPALEGRCDVRGLGKRLVSLHTLFYPSRFTLSSKYYVFFVCFFFFFGIIRYLHYQLYYLSQKETN